MKGNFFNVDSPYFKIASRIGDVLLLNFVFLIACCPVITIGPALTAMFYVSMKLSKGQDGYVIKNFIKAFKENFKQALLIYLLILVSGGLVCFAAWYWLKIDGIGKIIATFCVILGTVIVMMACYVFAVLAKFENSIKDTIKNAFLMSIRHFHITILIVVILVSYVVFNLTIETALIISTVAGCGIIGYVLGMCYNMVFRSYVEDDDEKEDNI